LQRPLGAEFYFKRMWLVIAWVEPFRTRGAGDLNLMGGMGPSGRGPVHISDKRWSDWATGTHHCMLSDMQKDLIPLTLPHDCLSSPLPRSEG
jgi:hypothetical protein